MDSFVIAMNERLPRARAPPPRSVVPKLDGASDERKEEMTTREMEKLVCETLGVDVRLRRVPLLEGLDEWSDILGGLDEWRDTLNIYVVADDEEVSA